LVQFNVGFPLDFEDNMGLHPYATDYIKIAGINFYFAKKIMTETRSLLYEDETYPIINAHIRSAFLLSDGAPDSS
jgi:hypothetical protein